MTLLVRAATCVDFTCLESDSLLTAIERCLDNRTGTCFIVDQDRRVIGHITLDDVRRAIRDGIAANEATLAQHLAHCAAAYTAPARAALDAKTKMVRPVLDADGRLADVIVDRSREPVQVARPDLSHREFRAVLDAFISSWISSHGTYIRDFEEEFASYIGMKHGIAASNGTAALHLALLALGIGPGDEVILPDLTFAATINAVLYCGATPVLVDVDRLTWTMTLASVEAAFGPRTKAIIPVHLYGRPAEIGPIADFAKAHGCAVVEDCAEAHGARYAGRPVGQFSDASCFSFYANKIVATGEGGMCLTNSEALASTMLELRNHGMTPHRWYWHERVGYNYRMTNLQAAIGVTQLGRIEETLERNRRLERLYRMHLDGIPGIKFPEPLPAIYDPVVWLVSAQVPATARARLIADAADAEIELRPFFHPLSQMPAYAPYARSCPTSALLAMTGINLPTSSAVDEGVVKRVAALFRDSLRG